MAIEDLAIAAAAVVMFKNAVNRHFNGTPKVLQVDPRTQPMGNINLQMSSSKGGRRGKFAGIDRSDRPIGTLYEVTTLEDRIKHIKAMIEVGVRGKEAPLLWQIVRREIGAKCGDDWCVKERGWNEEVQAIYDFVKANVRYTHDIKDVDTYASPLRVLEVHAGDCLPEGTLLLKYPGVFVPIESIEIGDKIMGDGDWTEVTNKWDKGLKDTLDIGLNNGGTLSCTPDHKVFKVPKRKGCNFAGARGTEIECRARDIVVGDDLHQPERLPFGDVDEGADKALLIGAYISEGWHDKYKACGVKAWLKALLTTGYSEESVRFILKGMEMGDGGYARSSMVYSTTSVELALQYRVLQRMMGLSVHLRRVDDHGGFGSHPIYRVTRRHEKDVNGKVNRPWARVRSISDGGQKAVWDIETTSHRIYLPESDVIVHNCDCSAGLVCALLMQLGYRVKLRVIRTNGSPDWNHIYSAVGVPPNKPTKWVPLDTTVNKYAGWEAPASMVAEKKDFEVSFAK